MGTVSDRELEHLAEEALASDYTHEVTLCPPGCENTEGLVVLWGLSRLIAPRHILLIVNVKLIDDASKFAVFEKLNKVCLTLREGGRNLWVAFEEPLKQRILYLSKPYSGEGIHGDGV